MFMHPGVELLHKVNVSFLYVLFVLIHCVCAKAFTMVQCSLRLLADVKLR